MILFIELGALTPPMGLNLFAIQSITERPPWEIAWASMPYAIIISLFSFALYFFPISRSICPVRCAPTDIAR